MRGWRRLWALLLLLILISGCDSRVKSVASPIDAGFQVVHELAEDKSKISFRADDMNEDELFRTVEAIWPYAATMKIVVYEGGLYEISMDIAEQARQEQAEEFAAVLARQVTQGMTDDVEKLRALHDALIRGCTYDLETAQNEGQTDGASAPFTAYGALVDGKAVCAGYARAFTMLCRAAGLDSIYIVDAGMNHGWNAVRVQGKTYYIDTTFDDPVPDRGEYVSYDYFLLNEETFQKTHSWDKEFYDRVMNEKWGISQ